MSILGLFRTKKTSFIVLLLVLTLPFQNCGGGFHMLSQDQLTQESGFSDGTVDNQAPVVSILTPLRDARINLDGQLSGTCEATLPLTYSFNDAPEAQTLTCPNSSTFMIDLPDTLADGPHIFTVSQLDRSGNFSSVEVPFTLDTVAPMIRLTSPMNTQSAEVSTSVNVSGSCEAGLEVEISGSALAAPLKSVCVNSVFQTPAVLRSVAGPGIISVSQTDLASNSQSFDVSITLTASTLPVPSIAITSPPANQLTNNRTLTLSGTCESGLTVSLSGAGLSSPSQANCDNGTFSVSIQLSASDGLKNVMASQTNTQNRVGQSSRSFQLDMTAPALAIVTPAAGFQSPDKISIGGNCETGLLVMLSGSGLAMPSSVNCNSGMFAATVDLSAGTGIKAVQVTQTDAAGNASTAQRNFERTAAVVYDGYALYATNCSACHSAITRSEVAGSSSTQISRALSNIGAMRAIKLTQPEIDAISFALNNPK